MGVRGAHPAPPDSLVVIVDLVTAAGRVSPGVPPSSTDGEVVTLIFPD